jgi:hypothetical protein
MLVKARHLKSAGLIDEAGNVARRSRAVAAERAASEKCTSETVQLKLDAAA